MSHYAVLVVGPDIEGQLQPYHEFECTGTNDEFVQEVDQTDEARKEYTEHTSTRYKDPGGNLHDPFTAEGNWNLTFWRELTPEEVIRFGNAGCFYQDRDAKEHGIRLYSADWKDGNVYHTKAFAWPSEGWQEVEVPTPSVETFQQFVKHWYGAKAVPFGTLPDTQGEHKYGYALLDESGEVAKIIDRTNPQKKWDWWEIGGRYTGFFKLREVSRRIVLSSAEIHQEPKLGTPGIQRLYPDYKPPEKNRADQCFKRDIDIEGMRNEAGERAGKEYDLFARVTAGCPRHLSWKEIQKKHQLPGTDSSGDQNVDWDAARKEYGDQPAVKALRESKESDAHWFDADDFLCTHEEYIEDARKKALITFAVVKDGKWYEKGQMGWWAIVSNKKDDSVWLNEFNTLLDGLPDDTILTVVDCHI